MRRSATVAGALLVSLAAGAQAQQTVVRSTTVPPKAAPAYQFTGSVTLRSLTKAVAPGRADTGLVTFSPGARSNWHTHPAGQTLVVTDGCGWTQAEGGPVTRICKGDVVHVAPGIRHWHGATTTTAMSHIAVTETMDGRNVGWLEPVTATQFHGPTK